MVRKDGGGSDGLGGTGAVGVDRDCCMGCGRVGEEGGTQDWGRSVAFGQGGEGCAGVKRRREGRGEGGRRWKGKD